MGTHRRRYRSENGRFARRRRAPTEPHKPPISSVAAPGRPDVEALADLLIELRERGQPASARTDEYGRPMVALDEVNYGGRLPGIFGRLRSKRMRTAIVTFLSIVAPLVPIAKEATASAQAPQSQTQEVAQLMGFLGAADDRELHKFATTVGERLEDRSILDLLTVWDFDDISQSVRESAQSDDAEQVRASIVNELVGTAERYFGNAWSKTAPCWCGSGKAYGACHGA